MFITYSSITIYYILINRCLFCLISVQYKKKKKSVYNIRLYLYTTVFKNIGKKLHILFQFGFTVTHDKIHCRRWQSLKWRKKGRKSWMR